MAVKQRGTRSSFSFLSFASQYQSMQSYLDSPPPSPFSRPLALEPYRPPASSMLSTVSPPASRAKASPTRVL